MSGITGIKFTQMFHTFLPSSAAELHHCFCCGGVVTVAAAAAAAAAVVLVLLAAGSAHCLREVEKCQPAMMFYKVKASEVLM